jgi:hypothetical protein
MQSETAEAPLPGGPSHTPGCDRCDTTLTKPYRAKQADRRQRFLAAFGERPTVARSARTASAARRAPSMPPRARATRRTRATLARMAATTARVAGGTGGAFG